MVYFYTRHHQGIASNETYQSTPRASQGKPEDNKQDTQRIPRASQGKPEHTQRITLRHTRASQRIPAGYQQDTKAGHETHHSIPNDTLRAILSDFICGLNMIVPRTN